MTPRERVMSDIKEVARWHGIPVYRLMSADRHREVVAARNAAYWLVWFKYGYSLPKIGRLFGRNHSTVLFGIGAHQGKINGPRCWHEAYTRKKRNNARAAIRSWRRRRDAQRAAA